MTELTITPKVSDKTARFNGTIAAGEHVAVTIKGGAEWIADGADENLTLRVIDLTTKRTLAVFPRPTETLEENETADAWDSSGEDLTCTLNLNTLRMVNAARHMIRVPVMFVLGDTDVPRTLYFCDRYMVEYWPERIGDDVPYDLDKWPKRIDDWTALVAEWTAQMAVWSTALAGKQDTISDLETIRAGAAKGATAIQSHQDISGKVDKTDLYNDATAQSPKIKAALLPSYVDDVLEYASLSAFPATGEEGKIYVAKDTNKTYRWSGTQYVQIGGSDMTVDSALSGTSTNPVQNKVVTEALASKLSRAEAEAGLTEWTSDVAGIISASWSAGVWTFVFIYDGAEETATVEGPIDATRLSPTSYVDVERTRLPTMADIPTKTSDLTNDSGFLTQHQQLAPVYSQTPTFSEWVCEPAEADGVPFGLVGDGSEGTYWMLVWGSSQSAQGYSDSTSLTWDAYVGRPAVTATRVRTDLIGYTLGGQTTKPLQPQGDYAVKSEMSVTPGTGANADKATIQLKTGTSATVLTSHQTWNDVKPSGGIPKTDLASAVQTSLGKADTALQSHQSLAGLMPMYPFSEPTMASGEPYVPAEMFPIKVTIDGTTYTATSVSSSTVGIVAQEGAYWLVSYFGGNANLAAVFNSDGTYYAEGEDVSSITFGTDDHTPTSSDRLIIPVTATVSPYTVATYTADSTAAAFEIAVGALPAGVTDKVRDCILVIDCTATGAVAPTVTWPSNFHPRTDKATDLAIVEARKRAVFYISEYATGEFAVGGWVETAGGSGT